MIRNIRSACVRLKYRWRILRNSGAELNRRAAVEQWLLDCADGKKPLPGRATCRWLALRLGTPKELWSDFLKAPPSEIQL